MSNKFVPIICPWQIQRRLASSWLKPMRNLLPKGWQGKPQRPMMENWNSSHDYMVTAAEGNPSAAVTYIYLTNLKPAIFRTLIPGLTDVQAVQPCFTKRYWDFIPTFKVHGLPVTGFPACHSAFDWSGAMMSRSGFSCILEIAATAKIRSQLFSELLFQV